MTTRSQLRPIGYVESPLVDLKTAPTQGFEGAPTHGWVYNADVTRAIRDLAIGAEVFVLTWLHHSRRDVLAVHRVMTRASPREACSAPGPRTDPI
jgi:tRNA (Thr-GGU) A37 N-methylase